jgi:hypothetical protein
MESLVAGDYCMYSLPGRLAGIVLDALCLHGQTVAQLADMDLTEYYRGNLRGDT